MLLCFMDSCELKTKPKTGNYSPPWKYTNKNIYLKKQNKTTLQQTGGEAIKLCLICLQQLQVGVSRIKETSGLFTPSIKSHSVALIAQALNHIRQNPSRLASRHQRRCSWRDFTSLKLLAFIIPTTSDSIKPAAAAATAAPVTLATRAGSRTADMTGQSEMWRWHLLYFLFTHL